MAQLPLDLGHRASFSGEDFLVAPCNQAAVAWLDRWPDWPAPGLAVHGPAGCGKTHLAHVFQAHAGAPLLAPADLAGAPAPRLLAGARAAILDGGPPLDEAALLHLYNHIAENRGHLLIVSDRPPARWNLALPDLASRLAALPAVGIEPPDDELIEAVLVKLFADRQLAVAPEVVTYLTKRVERSFETLRRLAGLLDRESLARHRRVTLPLAREIVERENP
jgi:chromosomal replication initiation ATPase DnaA